MSEVAKIADPSKVPASQKGKKRQFTLEFKKAIAARVRAGEGVVAVAKELGLSDSQVSAWSRGEAMGNYTDVKRHVPKTTVKPTAKTQSKKKPSPTRHKASLVEVRQPGLPREVKDAIAWLTSAESWMYRALREGELTQFDAAHDYARQALRELKKLQK